jgi:hypothetical protein
MSIQLTLRVIEVDRSRAAHAMADLVAGHFREC